MFRKTITVLLSAEDENMFARLLEHKAGQTARFELQPSQSQLMKTLIRESYLDLAQHGHRQPRLVGASGDSRPLNRPSP